MTDQSNLADSIIRSYGLNVQPGDRVALQKALGEIMAAAETLKKNRAMTDEPAAIFKLRPAERNL